MMIEPTYPQYEFLQANTREVWFCSGIAGGKTYAGAVKAIQLCLQYPGIIGVCCGISYAQTRDVILKMFIDLLDESIYTLNRSTYTLTFKNKSTLLFRSVDSSALQKLRGLTVAFVWIDEFAYASEDAYNVLLGRLRQKGYPHHVFLTSTPKSGSFYNKKLSEGVDPTKITVITGTTADNRFVEPEYLESLKERYGEHSQFYRQECLGELVSDDGVIFKKLNICSATDLHVVRRWYAVDPGFTHPTGIVEITDTGNILYITREFRQSHITDVDIINVLNEWNVGTSPIYVDSAAPMVIEALKRAGLNASKAQKQVLDGLQTVNNLFETEKLFIFDTCQQLIDELHTYIWISENVPKSVTDDLTDAMRYAVYTDARGKQSVPTRFKNIKCL